MYASCLVFVPGHFSVNNNSVATAWTAVARPIWLRRSFMYPSNYMLSRASSTFVLYSSAMFWFSNPIQQFLPFVAACRRNLSIYSFIVMLHNTKLRSVARSTSWNASLPLTAFVRCLLIKIQNQICLLHSCYVHVSFSQPLSVRFRLTVRPTSQRFVARGRVQQPPQTHVMPQACAIRIHVTPLYQ